MRTPEVAVSPPPLSLPNRRGDLNNADMNNSLGQTVSRHLDIFALNSLRQSSAWAAPTVPSLSLASSSAAWLGQPRWQLLCTEPCFLSLSLSFPPLRSVWRWSNDSEVSQKVSKLPNIPSETRGRASLSAPQQETWRRRNAWWVS